MSVAAIWKTGLILISGDPKVDFQLKLMDLAEDTISDIKVLSGSVGWPQTHKSRYKQSFNQAKIGG